MEELRIVVENYTLSNPELTTRMNIIKDSIRDIAKNGLTIGQQLKEIKDGDLWKDDYKDFVECAGQFGIKKAQAYNMIKSYEMAKKYNLEDYTPTALIEIGRLDSKKGEKAVKTALEKGQIKQSMAVSDLRKFVDKKVGKIEKALATKNQKAIEGQTEGQETEGQETEGQETNIVGKSNLECCFKIYFNTDDKKYYIKGKEGDSKEISLKEYKKIEELWLR